MIIVRCKQPIKIKQPLQRLLPFSYIVGEILQIIFLFFLFRFYFLNALQTEINSNIAYVLGHKFSFSIPPKTISV